MHGGRDALAAGLVALSLVACGESPPATDASAADDKDPGVAVSVLTEAIDRVGAASPVRLTSGDRASLGETLRTDVAGLGQLGYPDGSLTRLGPSTTYTVTALTATTVSRVIEGRHDLGSTWHNVKAATGDSRYEVSTPVGVAAVRGTAFAISCTAATSCTVTVAEGAVAFRHTDGAEVSITAGQSATFSADAVTRPPGPAAPDLWVDQNRARDNGAPVPTASASTGSSGSFAIQLAGGADSTGEFSSSQLGGPGPSCFVYPRDARHVTRFLTATGESYEIRVSVNGVYTSTRTPYAVGSSNRTTVELLKLDASGQVSERWNSAAGSGAVVIRDGGRRYEFNEVQVFPEGTERRFGVTITGTATCARVAFSSANPLPRTG